MGRQNIQTRYFSSVLKAAVVKSTEKPEGGS